MKKLLNIIICVGVILSVNYNIVFADDTTTHKNSAKNELRDLFSLYDEYYYSEENWQIMQDTYSQGIESINNAVSSNEAYTALNTAAENLIQVHHKGGTVKVCFASDKFTLNKGFITSPEFINTRIYTPVSNVIYDFYYNKFENKTRNPIYFSGSLEESFEITGIYEGIARTLDTPEEIELPNYLINYVGKSIPERPDLGYLKKGDYTPDSRYIYSVNNKFPNVKASAVPVCDEDVIRLHFSLYGKGADVGANILGAEELILTSADKSEAFWKLAEIHSKNDMKLLLSNESNNTNYAKALGAILISNVSQKAVDKAIDKLDALVPVTKPDIGENITPEPEDTTTPEIEKPVVFSDVKDEHFAKEAIDYMSSKGFISGRPDGTFGVKDKITRGELACILARINGLNITDASIPFIDVSKDDWFYSGVAFCYANNIVNGQTATEFNPHADITREELATMLYRYKEFVKITFDAETITNPFADQNEISEFALEAVTELHNASIISGYEGNLFLPKGNATRAEAIKMIYNILK